MEVKGIDLFSPLVVVVIILFYLFFGFICIQFHMKGLPSVSNITYIYVFFGILTFLGGYLFAKIIERYVFSDQNLGINTFLDYIEKHPNYTKNGVFFWVIFSIALQIVNLVLMGGIPIFSGYLKASAYNMVTILAYLLFILSINVLLVRWNRNKYFLLVALGVLVFALTGYRALIVGIILTILITVYYTQSKKREYFLILVPAIIFIGLIMGYVAAISIEWQQWQENALSLIFIRAGYTLHILDLIVNLPHHTSGLISYTVLTGFLSSVDPRLVLGQQILHTNSSITATLFGPAILEFGYIGLGIQMLFFGVILELIHYLQKIKKGLYTVLYGLGLSYIIIWVETSPLDLMVWIYFLAAMVVVISALISSILYNRSK
jgi:oligosaccharide repeat unit polymerase